MPRAARVGYPTTVPDATRTPRLVFGNQRPHRGTPDYPGGQAMWTDAALKYRVVTIAVGRRSGKTATLDFLDWEEGGRCPHLYQSAFVGQSHAHAEKRFEERVREFEGARMLVRSKNKGQDRWLEAKRWAVEGSPGNKGAIFHFWSGEEDAIDNTRGVGLFRLKVDEAGFIPEASMAALRPMLLERKGKTIITGTAKPEGVGFAWFRRYFYAGVHGPNRNPDYISFNAPSESNPFVDPKRVALERAECLTRAEEQSEFDGLFVEDDAAVFSNLDAVFSIKKFSEARWPGGHLWVSESPAPDKHYVIGCDFGKFHDASVFSVFCLETKQQVALGCTGRGVDFHDQFPLLHGLCETYGKPLVVADARGEGSLFVERLRYLYHDRIHAVYWSAGQSEDNDNNKAVYVTRGRHLCQSAGWSLMDVRVQREEFRLYMRTKRPRDNGYYYEAPSGLHDDFVSAALLAGSRLQLQVPSASRAVVEPSWWSLEAIDQREAQRQYGRALARYGVY